MMVKKARAAVMVASNVDLQIKEYPLPLVEKGCILVKITCCTICGSGLHSWLGHRKAPTPIIFDHEIVGEIVEQGKGVWYEFGDRQRNIRDRIT